jgi:uncharacterized membrane protein YgdD (TMEM256/DUF423 family)
MISASRLHLLIAGLMGAAGVTLWAMAAHRPGAASLVTVAHFLLFHACAVMGVIACRKQGLVRNKLANLSVTALILGSLLFSGDIAMRFFLQSPLFASAAPIGGSLTIVGWLMLVVAAMLPDNQS